MYRKNEGSWDPPLHPAASATRQVGTKGGPTSWTKKAGWVSKAWKVGRKGLLESKLRLEKNLEWGPVLWHSMPHTQEELICQWRWCHLPSLASRIVKKSNERWKCLASWSICTRQSLTPPSLTDTLTSSSHIKPSHFMRAKVYILRFASENKLFSSSGRKRSQNCEKHLLW